MLHIYKVKTLHANIYGLSANGMRSNKAILLILDGGSLPISGYNFVCVKSCNKAMLINQASMPVCIDGRQEDLFSIYVSNMA